MNEKLLSAKSDLEFIRTNFLNENKAKLNVCEIGSGNSKLLYLLEKEGLIKDNAVGYEISKSRFDTAERIRKILGAKKS